MTTSQITSLTLPPRAFATQGDLDQCLAFAGRHGVSVSVERRTRWWGGVSERVTLSLGPSADARGRSLLNVLARQAGMV